MKVKVELRSTDSRGRLSPQMLFPHQLSRHGWWTSETGGGRLTCLSFRCLSSYLIFSASFSDKQAAVRFAGARLDGLVRRPKSLHCSERKRS